MANLLSEKEEKDKYENNAANQDKFIDEILSPFYYTLMINNDESLNTALLNTMENKIAKLKRVNNSNINNEIPNFDDHQLNRGINNYYNSHDKNNNDYNIKVNSDNNSIIRHMDGSQKNNFINSNNQRVQNIENKELSLFSNINYLNKLTFNDEKIVADTNEKNE